MVNRVIEIEKMLLNLETPGNEIKYSIDFETESKVRYEFLCDTNGKERIDSLMAEENMSILDLTNEEKFQGILSKIKEDN